jgi:hypothetical protein
MLNDKNDLFSLTPFSNLTQESYRVKTLPDLFYDPRQQFLVQARFTTGF